MDFEPSDRAKDLSRRVRAFMDEHIYPQELEIEEALDREVNTTTAFPQILLDIREKAKAADLWNLFLPDAEDGPGLSNVDYGIVNEEIGRATIPAAYAFNCQPPDSGNMEILVEHANQVQRERWLLPLLAGEIRSCFSMTEPETAGNDPTGLKCRAERDGDDWVINGRKWWTTNALGASVAIVMAVTDPDAEPHKRATMLLVPTDAPGFNMVRPLSNMGHVDGPGHWEIAYEDCRVPVAEATLNEVGSGVKVAQDRLGPGRIHHCMRLIGLAERTLEKMCRRVRSRVAFGKPVSEQTVTQERIAESRIMIEQARLLTLNAAYAMDTVGNKVAKSEIAMIKVAVPNMACQIIDWAIQAHGGGGTSNDFGLTQAYATARLLRLADGPDEVHRNQIARFELKKYSNA